MLEGLVAVAQILQKLLSDADVGGGGADGVRYGGEAIMGGVEVADEALELLLVLLDGGDQPPSELVVRSRHESMVQELRRC